MRFGSLLFSVCALLIFAAPAFGQSDSTFFLSAENIRHGQTFEITKPLWKYRAGDDFNWINPDFDDSDWQTVNPADSSAVEQWRGWNGNCWFRAVFEVDASLVNQPVSFLVWQYGASEFYVDGVSLQKFGEIRDQADTEFNPQGAPVPFVFSKAGRHQVAVRYSFQKARDLSGGTGAWLNGGNFSPGFNLYLQSSLPAANNYNLRQLNLNEYKLFSGVLFAFAFLHFLLFIFYRRERANLYYSVFAFCLGIGNTLSSLYNNSRQSAFITALIFVFFVIFYSSSFVALLSFLYVAFADKFSRFFWLLCGYLVLLIGFMVVYSRASFTLYIVIGLMTLSIADALRIMVQALRRRESGAWIIMAGVGVFTLGVLMLLTRELQIAEWSGNFEQFRNFALYLAIPIAVSVYLARNFARVNHHLETKLIEVEAFSEREIEHEKEKARMIIIEAESERRAKELEEARALQLSMLPAKLPQINGLEIAAYMKPASEVGGDYYDFHTGRDGTLTVAVGDATGHGLKAGTVVTATKSLFNAFAEQENIPQIFNQTSGALKKMNLRGLFMAMAMLKIKDGAMTLCVAGMPSVLIYRAATKTVEEISLRAMPLGSITKTKYEEREISLLSGDCVVLMSDGFPEMFNVENEMLGFEKASEVLPNIADLSAQEIINHLVKVGDDWADGRPPDDDVTFVVLKFKDNTSAD